jgi:hypothetical protein
MVIQKADIAQVRIRARRLGEKNRVVCSEVKQSVYDSGAGVYIV